MAADARSLQPPICDVAPMGRGPSCLRVVTAVAGGRLLFPGPEPGDVVAPGRAALVERCRRPEGPDLLEAGGVRVSGRGFGAGLAPAGPRAQGDQHPAQWLLRIVLAGDTMLGRGVAEQLATRPPESIVAPQLQAIARQADLVLLNLECCISTRGRRWEDPTKPFFFRAPPQAVGVLTSMGTSCVTLGNNHALDYGDEALLDTFAHLDAAGIAWVGAGPDVERARAPAVLEARGVRVAVVGVTDHPAAYAAGATRPGVAFADLEAGVPEWLLAAAGSAGGRAAVAADAVVVLPHWGPNMTRAPVARVRRAAGALTAAGAALVAGHSAHVFHGVSGRVLYDLGDFVDDYATDPQLRNDLGLLWIVTLGPSGPQRVEAVPIDIGYCTTRPAAGQDARWVARRLESACREFATAVKLEDDRLVIEAPDES